MNSTDSRKLTYRLAEFAEAIGQSQSWVRQQIRAGKIPAFRLGKNIHIAAEDARAFLATQKVSQ